MIASPVYPSKRFILADINSALSKMNCNPEDRLTRPHDDVTSSDPLNSAELPSSNTTVVKDSQGKPVDESTNKSNDQITEVNPSSSTFGWLKGFSPSWSHFSPPSGGQSPTPNTSEPSQEINPYDMSHDLNNEDRSSHGSDHNLASLQNYYSTEKTVDDTSGASQADAAQESTVHNESDQKSLSVSDRMSSYLINKNNQQVGKQSTPNTRTATKDHTKATVVNTPPPIMNPAYTPNSSEASLTPTPNAITMSPFTPDTMESIQTFNEALRPSSSIKMTSLSSVKEKLVTTASIPFISVITNSNPEPSVNPEPESAPPLSSSPVPDSGSNTKRFSNFIGSLLNSRSSSANPDDTDDHQWLIRARKGTGE
jgi:hypothetical protein